MTRVLSVAPRDPSPAAISEAAAILTSGGLVAFPTETVYGLGARGLHPDEVAKIFAAKGRPLGHPVILHVDGEELAQSLAAEWSEAASRLAAELWPGPLTLVVPRAEKVPPSVSGGLDTVGIRSPSHPVALALIRAVGEPLAAPSANAHTHVSPTTAEHVVRSLGDRVDLVLDGGPCEVGIESTVVSLAHDPPRVLRPGSISLERLRAIVPGIVHETMTVEGDAARAAPGMAAKHYAPRTAVVLVGRDELASTIRSAGARVAAIVLTEEARRAAASCFPLVVMPATPEGYARRLFAALHEVDAAGVDLLVIERVPSQPQWWAVADRLTRAARR